MTGFLDLLNFITEWIYCGVFFIFITTFLPLRGKSRLLHVIAFLRAVWYRRSSFTRKTRGIFSGRCSDFALILWYSIAEDGRRN